MSDKNCILVVDDNDSLRKTLSRELSENGYIVFSAANGREAINLVEGEKIDLVLLDIKMPELDGFEVLKYIKTKFPSLKVIMLTAYADLKNAMLSKKLGADDFTSKPFDLVDLFSTIDRVLQN
jgi:DNA-binding NtrC family response regulator